MADTPSGAVPRAPARDRRRRRPVGERRPLPRDLHGFAPLWICVVVLLGLAYWWGRSSGAAGTFQRTVDRLVNENVSDLSARWRSSVPQVFAHGVGWWVLIGVRWTIVAMLIAWKRWRQLAVFAASAALVAVIARWFPTAGNAGTGVPGHPSYAAAALAVTLVSVAYGLVPKGRWRLLALVASAALCVGLTAMILALTSETAIVYEAALRRFTPDDVAEAFAATRSVTVPSQLRTMVTRDERSLAKEFSLLAPARRRIPVQRWTLRRLALTGALLAGAVVALATTLQDLRSAGFRP